MIVPGEGYRALSWCSRMAATTVGDAWLLLAS
jgi:hypothetical protein